MGEFQFLLYWPHFHRELDPLQAFVSCTIRQLVSFGSLTAMKPYLGSSDGSTEDIFRYKKIALRKIWQEVVYAGLIIYTERAINVTA